MYGCPLAARDEGDGAVSLGGGGSLGGSDGAAREVAVKPLVRFGDRVV